MPQQIHTKSRVQTLDVLRVAATFTVVLLHTGAQNWNDLSFVGWEAANAFCSLARWSVPCFFMLSGYFFLDPTRPLSLKTLYSRYIKRIVLVLPFASLAYALVNHFPLIEGGHSFVAAVISGEYHLWYLQTLIGLYMLTPILRRLTSSLSTTCYFLLLGIAYILLSDLFSLPGLRDMGDLVSNLGYAALFRYSFYYVLGYYLKHVHLSRRSKHVLYALGALAALSIIVLTRYISHKQGVTNSSFFNHFSIFALLVSTAVFYASCQPSSLPKHLEQPIYFLSKCSFGIYLVHIFVLDGFERLGFSSAIQPSWISIPLVALATFSVSTLIVFILKKQPFVARYL